MLSLYPLTFLYKGEDLGKKNQGCQWSCRKPTVPESTTRRGSASLLGCLMRTMYKNQGQRLESKNDTAGKGGAEPKGGVSE